MSILELLVFTSHKFLGLLRTETLLTRTRKMNDVSGRLGRYLELSGKQCRCNIMNAHMGTYLLELALAGPKEPDVLGY